MNNTFLKVCLMLLFIYCTSAIFYYKNIESRSYNKQENYKEDYGHPDQGYTEMNRTVLMTENANLNGFITALGIIAGVSLLSIVSLIRKDSSSIN